MVSIGDVKTTAGRMGNPNAKSKQFTVIMVSMGLLVLLLVFRTTTTTSSGMRNSKEAIKSSSSIRVNGSSDQRLTSNEEYEAKFNTGSNNDNDDNDDQDASSNSNSNDEQSERRIRQISLLGERNSGTRWSYQHLSECFNHSITVERHLTRYKHWFQYPNDTAYPHDTLVIAQFRNPYDWLKAMQRVPHHAPSHLKKDWKPFLTIPWTAPRLGADIGIGETINESNNDTDTTPCQQNFIFQDIVSCVKHPLPESAYGHKLRFSEDTPFYEMRPNSGGQPFKNIMEMRSAKIENFLSVQDYPGIAAVWAVQYEYLLQRGTEHLLQRISEWTGIEPQCDPYPAQLRRERPFEAEFVEHVTKHLNWTAEKLIGYGKYKQRVPPKDENENN